MREPAARAVVSDDGATIWLTAYTASGDAVPVVLLPVRAVAVAHALLAAAIPMLACREKSNQASAVAIRALSSGGGGMRLCAICIT